MAFNPKTDYLGLATTGLETVENAQNASNTNLDIPASNGSIIATEKFGSIKAPHVDYKITGNVSSLSVKLGKVHGATGSASVAGPYALRSISIHTGAGDEPTFGADGVQLEAAATKTICTYTPTISALSPARHALTFGAFSFTESSTLTQQSGDYLCECEIDPTTINGVPKASDAVKAYEQVVATFWTDDDETAPTVTLGQGWQLYSDWDCTGSDGAMFVWTATWRKFLAVDVA